MEHTRRVALDACRRALREHVGRFREVKDELFIINGHIVRPKGTGTAEQDWVWDPAEPDTMQPIREDFYLLHDVNFAGEFFIVPSEFVRGSLEAAHYSWHMEDPANRKLEFNSMRRLQKWPVRHFKGAWRLLGSNEEFLAYSDVSLDNDQSRAALLAKGYTPCTLPKCKRLIKNMEQHRAAHDSGLLNDEGRRTDKAN